MHVEQPVEVEFQHHHFQIDINHDLSHAVLSIILFHSSMIQFDLYHILYLRI